MSNQRVAHMAALTGHAALRPWRTAGIFTLSHVVLLFSALPLEVLVEQTTSPDEVARRYGEAPLARVLAGGYIEAMSFLVLLVAVVAFVRALADRAPLGVAAYAGQALAVVLVAATLAVGLPPAAAAIYGSQHGADIHAVLVVNDIRTYGYALQVAVEAAMVLAVSLAARTARVFRRWSVVGVVLGAVGILAAPVAMNLVSMITIVWLVVLGVLCVRGPREDRGVGGA